MSALIATLEIVGQVGGDRETEKAGQGHVHSGKLTPQVSDVGLDAAAAYHLL